MKNLHILPTSKPSRLYEFGGAYYIQDKPQENFRSYNIYITGEEKIRIGDWVIDDDYDEPVLYKADKYFFDIGKEARKIILTTDTELIDGGVQNIQDVFLSWLIQNPTCEKVEVRKNPKVSGIVKGLGIKSFDNGYKIIIPKNKNKEEKVNEPQNLKNFKKLDSAAMDDSIKKKEAIDGIIGGLFKKYSNNTSLAEGDYEHLMDSKDFREASIELIEWLEKFKKE